MSEIQKVQQGPSTTPYLLGGGLAGAAIGGVATQFGPGKSYVTEAPKYKSHEDLVKAAEDKFENIVEEAEKFSEADKSFSDKVKAQQENIKKAGEQYDADLAKHLEEGKKQVVVADTDEIKELNKQLEAAKANLAESEKALAAASPKEAIKNPTRMDVIGDKIKPLETQVKAEKSIVELMDKMEAQKSEIATKRNQFREAIKLPEQEALVRAELDVHQATLDALKQKKNAVTSSKQYKELVAKRAKLQRGSAEYQQVTQQIEQMRNQYNSTIAATEAKIKNIKNFKKNGKELIQELDNLVDAEALKMAKASSNKETTAAIRANSEKVLEAKIREIRGLTNQQRKDLLDKVKAQLNDRTSMLDSTLGTETKLNETIAKFERDYSTTRRKIFEHNQFKPQLAKKEAELNKLKDMQSLAKKREAHIKKMWAQRKEARKLDGKKVVDATFGDLKAKEFNYTSFTDSLNQTEKDLLKEFQKETRKRAPKVVKTTPATEGLTAAVESNKAKITELTSQIAKKREALPKPATKTVEELTAEFVKEKGTKEASVKEATRKAVNELKDDVAGWLEKATKTNGKKVAWIAVGAAVAGALIGLALKPSKKEA